MFSRQSVNANDHPRVITYINTRLFQLQFLLRKNITNHRDINLILFFNCSITCFIIIIYSDNQQIVMKYLKNIEVNLNNVLIITGDFNISDTNSGANSVIDLMFLWNGLTELNNHSIHPDWQLSLDHAPLTVTIPITEENIVSSKFSIVINSEEGESFINDVLYAIKNININDLSNINKLKFITNMLASKIENVWRVNNIMRQSKSWWNKECSIVLSNYRTTWSLENWKIFKNKVKTTKWSFFDVKIQEITNKKQGSWELMSWVNKHKLPTIEAIKYNDQQCLDIDNLWNALHSTFNTALHRQVDVKILDEISEKLTSP